MSSGTSAERRNEKLWWWVRQTGLSYAEFARELWITAKANGRPDLRPDRTRIGHWINDGQVPRQPLPEFLAQTVARLRGCIVEPADLGLPRTLPPSAGLGAVDVARAFARHATSSELAPSDVAELDLAVHELTAAYPNRPPGSLWDSAMRHRQTAHTLLHHRRHTLREGREIARHAGMLSVVLAWIAHDTGDHEAVAAFAADARTHGHQSDAPEVTAWAEDVLATDTLYDGRPLDALAAATRGLAVAPRGSHAAYRLTAQLARAHARLGDEDGYQEAARRTDAHRPALPQCRSGLFGFDRVGIDSFNASSFLWLGRPQKAHDAATAAIGQYRSMVAPAAAPTRLAVTGLDLALAHAALGDPDEAVRAGRAALLGVRVVDAVLDRAHQLDLDLRRRFPGRPITEDFRDQARAMRPVA
ncbi:XRE family transcriptional regulator [Streptomyces venezuelae]|uniref:XRE family transcriptional regulator n=1 Tax=Streptomyces venezuelae TaxID=54571 RepID=UPI001238C78C|nr:XRE family transcriptional regulator [Streptomyces venezuelae]